MGGQPPITPKQALLQFMDRQGLRSGLKFAVKQGPPPPAQPFFHCTATVPVFDAKTTTYIPKDFYGEGGTKKASEHAASKQALEYINGQGLLTDTLKAALDLNSMPGQQQQQLGQQATEKPSMPLHAPSPASQYDNQGPPKKARKAPEAVKGQAEETNLNGKTAEAGATGKIAAGIDITMANIRAASDAEVEAHLGNRKIADLTPVQLKDELQTALDKNTQLKSAIYHEQQRREKALNILLGLGQALQSEV